MREQEAAKVAVILDEQFNSATYTPPFCTDMIQRERLSVCVRERESERERERECVCVCQRERVCV